MTANLGNKREAYRTSPGSIHLLEDAIHEFMECLTKMQNNLSALQRDRDNALAESVQLESACGEVVNRL